MKILLADDDVVLVDLLRFLFKREHFQVLTAFDGEAAWREFRAQAPDIVLLDLNMPKRSGIEVLKQIRRQSETPVIVLSATTDQDTIVEVLGMGADDYIEKPFEPRELVARVKTRLRRTIVPSARSTKSKKVLKCSEFRLDLIRQEFSKAGSPVQLTRHEFSLIEYLMQNCGRVVSVKELMQNVWGDGADVTEDVVKQTILRLRRKVGSNPSNPTHVVSGPSGGYMCNDKV